MLKRPITYTDFNGNKVTEDFYFNLSVAEAVEMEVSDESGSLGNFLKTIVAEENKRELMRMFKELISAAYGEKSEDGKYFLKSEEMRRKFLDSAAYAQLFVELVTNEQSVADFIIGVLPADLQDQARAATGKPQDKPIGLPPRPPQV